MQRFNFTLMDKPLIGEQPWVPAGLAEKLVPGARVRIRLNGECSQFLVPDISGLMRHEAWEDGIAGTIAVCLGRPCIGAAAGHPYRVIWDRDVHGSPGGHYAAIELIPLDMETER